MAELSNLVESYLDSLGFRLLNQDEGFLITEGHKTHIDDLALVCSNCHRMIHRSKHWFSVAELKAIIAKARAERPD